MHQNLYTSHCSCFIGKFYLRKQIELFVLVSGYDSFEIILVDQLRYQTCNVKWVFFTSFVCKVSTKYDCYLTFYKKDTT